MLVADVKTTSLTRKLTHLSYNMFQNIDLAINSLRPSDAYMGYRLTPSLVPIMACCLAGTKPYRNSYIFIEENQFENVILKMVYILSRPQIVH